MAFWHSAHTTDKPFCQIIREQCWLNEILSGCQWVPEGMEAPPPTSEPEDISVTEDELQAVLKGVSLSLYLNLFVNQSFKLTIFPFYHIQER